MSLEGRVLYHRGTCAIDTNQQQDDPTPVTLPVSIVKTPSHNEGGLDSGIEAVAPEPVTVPLPLWQRTYLGALQAGAGQEESAKSANVSTGVIAEWTDPTGPRYDAVFARARGTVMQGIAVLGVDQVRQMATEASALMVTDAIAESRDAANAARDRLGNRSFVAEAGVIMPQRGGVVVNVQTNVGFSRRDASQDTVAHVAIDPAPS